MTPKPQAVLGVQLEPAGLLLTVIASGGPAEKAGLLKGDVLQKVDGAPVSTMADLLANLRMHKPGEKVTVTLMRKGEPVEIAVTLGEPAPSEDKGSYKAR